MIRRSAAALMAAFSLQAGLAQAQNAPAAPVVEAPVAAAPAPGAVIAVVPTQPVAYPPAVSQDGTLKKGWANASIPNLMKNGSGNGQSPAAPAAQTQPEQAAKP